MTEFVGARESRRRSPLRSATLIAALNLVLAQAGACRIGASDAEQEQPVPDTASTPPVHENVMTERATGTFEVSCSSTAAR